jgi:hypothetical protein
LTTGTKSRFACFVRQRGSFVKKLHEYIEHADECRKMARVALPQHRTQLEQMALMWEQLAEARRRQLAKQSEEDDETGEGKRLPSEAVRLR